jgi:hypothetical protein
MALVLKPEMVREIAQQLDCGMTCFYHTETGELESYPDFNRNPGYDTELWEESIEKVEANYLSYLRFDTLESHESFRIMADFTDEIRHAETRNRFIHALEQRKPFQQFKSLLHYYPDLLKEWYTFKDQRCREYVIEIVAAHNSRESSKDSSLS